MKIIAQTPRRLELGYQERNLSWSVCGATLFGFAFIGLGIWGIFTGRQKILKCTRIDSALVECQLTSSGIIGSQTTKLSEVKEAEIVVRKSATNRDRQRRDVYSVVLVTNDRRILVSGTSTSNYDQKKADVRRINSFLNNPQQFVLKMQSDSRWLGLIVGSILASVGLAIIYALWQIKIVSHAVFDRNSGILEIEKRSAYGKTEKLDWRLAKIEQLWIEESDSEENKNYSLNLQFFPSQQSSLTLLRTNDRFEAEMLATNIRQFIAGL